MNPNNDNNETNQQSNHTPTRSSSDGTLGNSEQEINALNLRNYNLSRASVLDSFGLDALRANSPARDPSIIYNNNIGQGGFNSIRSERSVRSVHLNRDFIESLIRELRDVTRFIKSSHPTWETFVKVKKLLQKLEESQNDLRYKLTEINQQNQIHQFQNLYSHLHHNHQMQLELIEANKENYKILDEYQRSKDPSQTNELEHLNLAHRELVKLGLDAKRLPKFTYPEQLEMGLFKLSFDKLMGFGVTMAEPIMKGKRLLQIPRHSIMTSFDAVFDPDLKLLMKGKEELFQPSSKLRLVMLLYFHKLRDISSPFKSYIETLPKRPNSPLYYTLEEIDPFRGSYIIGDIINLTIECARYYSILYSHFSDNSHFDLSKFTYSSFVWCYATVLTRSINLPLPSPPINNVLRQCNEIGLVPILDLMNFTEEGGLSPYFNSSNGCLELVSDKILNEDDEVLLNYPLQDNREMILKYGMVSRKKLKFDSVKVPLSLFKPNDPTNSTKLYLCRHLKIPAMYYFRIQHDGITNLEKDKDLLQFVILATQTPSKLKELEIKVNQLIQLNEKHKLKDLLFHHLESAIQQQIEKGLEPTQASLVQNTLFYLALCFQMHLEHGMGPRDIDALAYPNQLDLISLNRLWIARFLKYERRTLLSVLEWLHTVLPNLNLSPFS